MALPDESDLLKNGGVDEQEPIEVIIEDEPEVEVEVVDDTPAEDRNRKPLPEGEAEPTEEEMEQYSEAVQKRIAKMKHGIHDERRAKEAAIREREEAIRVTQRLLEEKRALEARYNQGEDAFIVQSKEKADLAMAQAKRDYKEAYELGDAEAMANAQEKMADIAAARRDSEAWARQAAQRKETAGQAEQAVVQSQPSQEVSGPTPDPDAQEWAKRNKWFGVDDEMTQFAYGVHAKLVKSGLDPAIDSAEYYQKLNARMREVFPSYSWPDTKKKTVPSVVAPVGRTTNKSRQVTLTHSQVNIAKRLGVTPLQYAVELAKLENA